jgi:hypothetical protein
MTPTQALLLASAGAAAVVGSIQNATRPNFIFIMTDDQDLHLNSIDYQPSVQKHFAQEGTWFKKHFCTVALCCPSRVSLLTGKAAHNTNVTDVSAPYGKFDPQQQKCCELRGTNIHQVDIQGSLRKGSMMIICQSGCRTLDTTRITPAS